MNESKTQLRRYNIYSCLTIRTANLEICFDPAKIRDEDLEKINPDYIFISHESMDHMDPTQVYILQKKKNCKIYCSIASAVDLIQQFPYDTEFIGKINALVPGCTITNKDLIIETQKSLHCDYMLPLVYKISIKKDKISVLHCFDSFISDKIIDLSKDTSMAIVPIGIAKGVSINSGIEFLEKLESKKFMTNHFKSHEDLENFKGLINNDNRFIYMNWDESTEVNLEQVEIKKDNYELEEVNFILDKTYIAGSNTYKAILSNMENNQELLNQLKQSIDIIINALRNKKIIYACGNGGSASDAQNFVSELISKFNYNRKSLGAVSLTTNPSIITSIGNDYNFDNIFKRQIEGLGNNGDVLVALSTSGNSNNIVLAIKEALAKGMKVIFFTSEKCNSLDNENMVILKVPSSVTPRIQEIHIMLIHYLCEEIENYFKEEKNEK